MALKMCSRTSRVLPDTVARGLCHISWLVRHEVLLLAIIIVYSEGQCLNDNFYVRGDKTLVYYFTEGIITSLILLTGH